MQGFLWQMRYRAEDVIGPSVIVKHQATQPQGVCMYSSVWSDSIHDREASCMESNDVAGLWLHIMEHCKCTMMLHNLAFLPDALASRM